MDVQWPLCAGETGVEYSACAAMFFRGDIMGANRIAEEGYQAAVSAQAPLLLGGWALFRGVIATAGGRVVTAQALLREAAVLLEETDIRMHTFCLTQLAAAVALAGRRTEEIPEPDDEVNSVLRPWHERARAWVLVSRGLVGEAVAVLNRAAENTASPAAQAYLLYDVARLGGAVGVEDRLRELAQRLGSRFAHALATCAEALTAADHPRPDLIARAATVLAGLGHTPLAAEAMTVAARAARRRGQRSRALLYVEKAAALSGLCEGLRTPLLAFATRPALTPREREILLMAAGYTSAQIAAHLGLAVTTVNNHLANAYAKLGIAGRRELVALLSGKPWGC